jgi:hypothetical protein
MPYRCRYKAFEKLFVALVISTEVNPVFVILNDSIFIERENIWLLSLIEIVFLFPSYQSRRFETRLTNCYSLDRHTDSFRSVFAPQTSIDWIRKCHDFRIKSADKIDRIFFEPGGYSHGNQRNDAWFRLIDVPFFFKENTSNNKKWHVFDVVQTWIKPF